MKRTVITMKARCMFVDNEGETETLDLVLTAKTAEEFDRVLNKTAKAENRKAIRIEKAVPEFALFEISDEDFFKYAKKIAVGSSLEACYKNAKADDLTEE